MRKTILITLVAIGSIAATPAVTTKSGSVASDNAADQATQVAQVAPAPAHSISAPAVDAPATEEKKVCRLLPSSYSHHSDRVCLTKEQWAQVDADLGN